MHEIELKFKVAAARRDTVARAVGGRRVHLQAAYVDTADRALAAAGLAMRVRREGRHWVQTLKGEAVDGLTRLEHNVPRPGGAREVPSADPALHAGTAPGVRLAAVLAAAADPGLIVHYRTDIWRQVRSLRTAHGRVELAFDQGFISAGERRVPVCELEIELLSGSPAAVLVTARRWVRLQRLWLDTRSKAERGDRLSRGDEAPAAAVGVAPRLRKGLSLAQARQLALQDCWRQIGWNASEVAAGSVEPEHVHQLRVGLRRLRSLARFLSDSTVEPVAWLEPAAELFRQLGVLRDRDAIAAAVLPRLKVAVAHLQADVPKTSWPEFEHAESGTPTELVRSEATQKLLLALLEAMASPPAHSEGRREVVLVSRASRRLERWHAYVLSEIRRFGQLDDVQRHALRKRVKRLRYCAEWVSPLFPRHKTKRYLAALREVQSCLGDINDLSVASQAFGEQTTSDPRSVFALGWLAGQREALLASAPARLAAFAKAKRFWTSA